MSEFNPADLGLARRSFATPASADPDDVDPGGEEPRREREGLPSSYRMRADPHYVDLLTSQPSRAGEEAPSAASRSRRTAELQRAGELDDPADPRVARVLDEIAEDLSTIASAAALLSTDPPPMARRVNIDLIRAQAWRASWLVGAYALLGGARRFRAQPLELGSLFLEIREGFAPECRLTGASLRLDVPDWTTPVPVDRQVLQAGVAGAVVWTLGRLGQADGAVITIAADVANGRLASITVSQTLVAGPAPVSRRTPGTPGQDTDEWLATLGASVAKAAARLHDGEAALFAGDGPGSTVRFTFAAV